MLYMGKGVIKVVIMCLRYLAYEMLIIVENKVCFKIGLNLN